MVTIVVLTMKTAIVISATSNVLGYFLNQANKFHTKVSIYPYLSLFLLFLSLSLSFCNITKIVYLCVLYTLLHKTKFKVERFYSTTQDEKNNQPRQLTSYPILEILIRLKFKISNYVLRSNRGTN